MRPGMHALLLLATIPALSGEAVCRYPLWDGQESNAAYSKRSGLEPTKTLDLGNGVKLELVLIPAGKFVMGTPEPRSFWLAGGVLTVSSLALLLVLAFLVVTRCRRRRSRLQFSLSTAIVISSLLGVALYGGVGCWQAMDSSDNYYYWESPAHEVTISAPFYLGKLEVTQKQYQQVMGEALSDVGEKDLPMVGVTWDDAVDFCKKLSKNPGRSVRLPTEAEWEYAYRTGMKHTLRDSFRILDQFGWYWYNSGGRIHPGGEKDENRHGIRDMPGNVWEWCEDWNGDYVGEAQVDPRGPVCGKERIIRGGSFYSGPEIVFSPTFRSWSPPGTGGETQGFRICLAIGTDSVKDHHPAPPSGQQ